MQQSGHQKLSGQKLTELAGEFGTPLYVYDLEAIVARYQELSQVVPYRPLSILYAMKANYCPAILQELEKVGASLDTVSPAEVELALKLGYSPERLLYTANNITDEEMERVLNRGVMFNVGSLSRLEKLGKAHPGARVCLRFNPDVVAGAHKKIQTGGDLTKFGILLVDADLAMQIAKKHKLSVVGLHKHTGSGIKESSKFLKSVGNLLSIATPERFPDLEFVDFGGGFGVPYEPGEVRIDYRQFGADISESVASWAKDFPRQIQLLFEPGKYIVAEAGYFIIQVNTLKDNRGRLIAGTNSGFPQLIRPMFYDAYHHVVNLSNPDAKALKYDVCGNICETGDCFAREREIAEIREGDYLCIENAGAYCYAMGGVYNLRAMPAEACVRGDNSFLARRRLSDEQLVEQILGESVV